MKDGAHGQVEAECGPVAMAMVQNKCDLLRGGGVSAEAAEAMARRLGLRFYRTCARGAQLRRRRGRAACCA